MKPLAVILLIIEDIVILIIGFVMGVWATSRKGKK